MQNATLGAWRCKRRGGGKKKEEKVCFAYKKKYSREKRPFLPIAQQTKCKLPNSRKVSSFSYFFAVDYFLWQAEEVVSGKQ